MEPRRSLAAVALVGAVLLIGACGGNDTTTPGSTTQPRGALEPGPTEVGNVVPDELLVPGAAGDAYVADAVADAGGEIVSEDEAPRVRARFDVADREQLLKIRDNLRSRGVDARVIAALDPEDLGSGTPDDPA